MEERIMKKCFSNIRTLAALLMAGAAFGACSSDDNSIEQPANPTASKTYTLTVNASKGDASTRALALDGTKLVAKWADGDELYVYKATNRAECISDNKLGTISTVASAISADGDQATFTGNLSGTVTVSTDDNLMLVYHPAAFAIANFEGQAGTLTSASALDCATAQVTASVSGSDITIKETSATFTTHTAMLKLTLQDNAATPNKLKANSLKMSMSLGSTTLKEFTFSPTDATYTANGNGVLYFALPSVEDVAAGLSTPSNPITTTQLAGVTITYAATVGSDTYTATKTTGYKFAAGSYYTGTLTMAKAVPEGAINGRFSVSDTKKVYFSKGNLQATYNTSWSWAFATNQWDYIGNAAGNTSINGGGTISETGTVDLFGWVGAACAWTGAAQYGISNVKQAAQYGYVEGEALKSDWGTLAITNGGNKANFGWRTLTGGDASSEWDYLFKTRTTPSGVRYAHATVNDVPGLVLLPDDWSTDYYSLDNVNDATDTDYTDNVISSSDWTSKLEAHGAVFLPAGGYRNGAEVSDAGVQGTYWSSTSSTTQSARGFYFRSASFGGNTQNFTRNRGCSVRLVYDAN